MKFIPAILAIFVSQSMVTGALIKNPIQATELASAVPIKVVEVEGDIQAPPGQRTVAITRYTLSGSGCPGNSTGIITYLDDSTLTIIFDKFGAVKPSTPNDNSTFTVGCEINVYLVYAAHTRNTTVTETLRGEAIIYDQATCTFVQNFALVRDPKPKDFKFDSPDNIYQIPQLNDRIFRWTQGFEQINPYCTEMNEVMTTMHKFSLTNMGSHPASIEVFSADYTIHVPKEDPVKCISKS